MRSNVGAKVRRHPLAAPLALVNESAETDQTFPTVAGNKQFRHPTHGVNIGKQERRSGIVRPSGRSMVLNVKSFFVVLVAMSLYASDARAGPYTDKLGKCIVTSTTEQEKHQFLEWMFAALALNPSIAAYANISVEKREDIDKGVASLVETLIGERCKAEAFDALKKEGRQSFGDAFGLLGASSMEQLLSTPEVAKGTQAFLRYIDFARIAEKIKASKR